MCLIPEQLEQYFIKYGKFNEFNSYKYKKEIIYLKQENEKLKKNLEKKYDLDDIIYIHFISGDGKINQGIKCLKNDTFLKVEENLFQIYNEFKGKNLIFLHGVNLIIRNKTIFENKIKDGDKVQIHEPDEL